jgi:hypothetical protein
VVEQLLNRKTLRGQTYYLVRWPGQGHDLAASEDSWEPAEHLAHCPERVAEYAAACGRRPPKPRNPLTPDWPDRRRFRGRPRPP